MDTSSVIAIILLKTLTKHTTLRTAFHNIDVARAFVKVFTDNSDEIYVVILKPDSTYEIIARELSVLPLDYSIIKKDK